MAKRYIDSKGVLVYPGILSRWEMYEARNIEDGHVYKDGVEYFPPFYVVDKEYEQL